MDRLADNPMALAILRLTAFYASEPIPQALFEESFDLLQQQATTFTVEQSASTTPAEMVIRKALKELARYSMIDRHGHSCDVHALVQTVQRLEIPAVEKKVAGHGFEHCQLVYPQSN